jgi:hypothetical protein
MTSVRLRALAAVFALLPAAGLLAAAPARAATGITVKSVSVSKSAFVLSASAGCSTSISFTAVLSAPLPTDGYEFSGVGVDLYGPASASKSIDDVAFKQVGTSSTYQGSLKLCGKYRAGNYRAKVYGVLVAKDFDSDDDFELTNVITKGFTIKRPSKLSLNAAPEPVVKGKKIIAKGTLKIDGKVLSGAKVKVYFKAAGAGGYTYQGTATTSGKGVYSKKFTATKSGTWKAVYAGSSTRNGANAADAVKVK